MLGVSGKYKDEKILQFKVSSSNDSKTKKSILIFLFLTFCPNFTIMTQKTINIQTWKKCFIILQDFFYLISFF